MLRIPEPGRLPETANPEAREFQKERVLLKRQIRHFPIPTGTEENFPLNEAAIKLFLKRNQNGQQFISYLESIGNKDFSLDQLYYIVDFFKGDDQVLERLKQYVPPQSRDVMDMLDIMESTVI